MAEAMIFKTSNVQSLSSISMSTSSAPQSEVDIPNQGDLIGLNIELTQSTTGTLTGANTIDYAIENIAIKDRFGNPIWQNVRGRDLNEIEGLSSFFVNAKGIFTSVATTSSTAGTRRYHIPFRIDRAMFPCKIQTTLAPYSAMATSGATAGSVSVRVDGIYKDESANDTTDRILRISQSIVSGTNRFGPNLPKGRVISHLAVQAGTESNISKITMSRDGSLEIADYTSAVWTPLDQDLFNSGHQSGLVNLYNSPFVATEQSILDVEGAGSDTLQWFIFLSERAGN